MITCYIKGKSVVFYRDEADEGFHRIRIDICRTLPQIREQARLLAKEDWATPEIVRDFEEMAKQYHNLHLAK